MIIKWPKRFAIEWPVCEGEDIRSVLGATTELPQTRFIQLAGGWESDHFHGAKEVVAIELTEANTLLTEGFVCDEVYGRAADEFTETELVPLNWSTTILNAWNRFGVSTPMIPRPYAPGA